MVLDVDLLEEICSSFLNYAEEAFDDYNGLDIDLWDNMTTEECEKALVDAISKTFPIGFGPADPETGFADYEYTEYDFDDFLKNEFGIYLDYDSKSGKTVAHDLEEHEAWYKTTDHYKRMQRENATFKEAVENSNGTALLYPGFIGPYDRRIESYLSDQSKDTDFKFIIAIDKNNMPYLFSISDIEVDPVEFHVINPEGFVSFGYFDANPTIHLITFDSIESAMKAVEYLSVDFTDFRNFSFRKPDEPKFATDYIKDVIQHFGLIMDSYDVCGIIHLRWNGHRDSSDKSGPEVCVSNWHEALNLISLKTEKIVPFDSTDEIPVYKNSYEFAEKCGETNVYEESHQENIACLSAIQREVRHSPDKFHVPEEFINKVIDDFGVDRTSWVVANVIFSCALRFKDQGRDIATNMRQWAFDVLHQGDMNHNFFSEASRRKIDDPYKRVQPEIASDNKEYDRIFSSFAVQIQPVLEAKRTVMFDREPKTQTLKGRIDSMNISKSHLQKRNKSGQSL